MRKLTIISMITLDGVMQAPGGPQEDTSNGFEYGGWNAPFDDEVSNDIMRNLMKPSDLLLGRKTFQIWEDYWPDHTEIWPTINQVTKYVYSTTVDDTDWENTVFLNHKNDLEKLKNSDGSDVQVWGSSKLIQLLLKNDWVDELWLIIHSITLGQGKKLFTDEVIPANFRLIDSQSTPSGLIFAHLERNGEVKTGTSGI